VSNPEPAADQVGDPGGCQRADEVSVNLDSPLVGWTGFTLNGVIIT
jgi:hypothetical protein